jgi:hypothetical protein
VTTDRYSGPIGRLAQCAANGACSLLTTITFLGEQLDTTDPPRANATVSGRRGPAATQSRTDRRFGVQCGSVGRPYGAALCVLVGELANEGAISTPNRARHKRSLEFVEPNVLCVPVQAFWDSASR